MRSTRVTIILGLGAVAVVAAAGIFGPRFWDRFSTQYLPPPVCRAQGEAVTSTGAWSQGTAGSSIRGAAAFTTLDKGVYQAGGFIINWQPSDVFDVYDPASDRWETLAPLPTARHRPGLASAGGKIYMTGGFDGSFFWDPTLSDSWVYDPVSNQWTPLAPMPSARAAHTMVNINDQLFVMGGQGPDPLAVWVYDPATDTWDSSRAPLPAPERDNAAGVVFDGKIYLVGGRWIERGNFGMVDVYDPAADTWTRMNDMLNPRSSISGVVVDDRLHFLGGQDVDNACAFALHEVYDPASDRWTRLGDMPTARHSAGAVFVDGRLYVVGGATGAGPRMQYWLSGLVEIYSPA